MIARSLDVYVWLKLCGDSRGKTYAQLGQELGMSASEVHAAVRRGGEAGLVKPESKRVVREAFVDYLLHGVRYAFPAVPGRVVRGMPTGYSASCLAGEFAEVDLPVVWEDAEGSARGQSVEPLHPSAAEASRRDENFYRVLALVDALRCGRARERSAAAARLKEILLHDSDD
jgi:DNA-binding Lrp family transcriptional regulator